MIKNTNSYTGNNMIITIVQVGYLTLLIVIVGEY